MIAAVSILSITHEGCHCAASTAVGARLTFDLTIPGASGADILARLLGPRPYFVAGLFVLLVAHNPSHKPLSTALRDP